MHWLDNLLTAEDKQLVSGKSRLKMLFSQLDREQQRLFSPMLRLVVRRINNAHRNIKKYPNKYAYSQDLIHTKTKTLFILGSGPTINDLTAKNFREIAANDSWGFNYWLVHDHVPDVYFVQYSPYKKIEGTRILESCLTKKIKNYKNTKIIVKGGALDHRGTIENYGVAGVPAEAFKHPIGLMPVVNIPPELIKSMGCGSLFSLMHTLGFVNYNAGVINPAWQVRSTLGLLITLAINYGFKDIVLCGIDGYDNSHFYDDDHYLSSFPELKWIVERSHRGGHVHPHDREDNTSLSSSQIVQAYCNFASRIFGIRVYVASEKSIHSNQFPLYTFLE